MPAAVEHLVGLHVALHGTFKLELDTRLDYDRGAPAAQALTETT